jgi:serine/threonine protein kinase
MDRYKVTKELGDGTYGAVYKAVHRTSGMQKFPWRFKKCVSLTLMQVLSSL